MNQMVSHMENTRNQALYERILNNIYADIVVLDAQYRFLYVSPASVKDEETRKWLIGKTDEEFFRYRNKPLAMAERRMTMYETARNERRVIEWVERTETPFGSIKSIFRRIFPVFDEKGSLDILIGYSMNVTDIVTTQDELKTSRDTFQSAFHDSGIGMALLSPDGKWLDVNNVICELLEYSREELMKMSIDDIAYPGERREDRELIRKMFHREIPHYTTERRYISRRGKIIHVLLTITMVWSNEDTVKFFIAQAVDITLRRQLEDEINSKNRELEATRLKLMNKVNQLEELSYIIAHNLRGPAGNIKSLAEMLLAKADKPVADESAAGFTLTEGLGYIKEASVSLMDSLASLMQIAEIKLNKDIPKNECDVAIIIDEVTTQLQNIILEKQAIIHRALDVEVINYPRPYLESILYNFISNSLKYSKPGVPPEIYIGTRNAGDHIELCIKDNGLGIDMNKYGEKMFKLNQVFHAGHDSKGFGLYLTKTQVESQGGSITVSSRLNEGTEFVVMI